MAFTLQSVVPWGRNLNEYTQMFNLSEQDLQSKIISFGDGPASFNAEMKTQGNTVLSLDIIYQFSKEEIEARIKDTTQEVIKQAKQNLDKFVWNNIKNVEELELIRTNAMHNFLLDYELGKKEKRYVFHEMPLKTIFSEDEFDLGLSSHFLILYSQLGLDFHISSIKEMLRICKEIRIFPILNLNSQESEVLQEIINYFSNNHEIKIITVDYEFQKGGNKFLSIKKK